MYFVQDRWYQQVYVPQYRQRHAPPPPPSRKYKHDDRGDDRGNKQGRGHGKGRDKD